MMPSWFEEIQRRKRGMQGTVPPDLMSGATPPFNPDAGSPLPQPWEMDPAVRGATMPQPPARPPRPVEEEIGPPPQMGAQQAMSQRVQDLEAAQQRQREMPGWRKALGGVLEGIGSGRRGGLGGLARVGGGALTGRNAVQDIEQSLPAYDRAADNERAINAQAENLALRKQQLRQRQIEADTAEETKKIDQQNRVISLQSNRNLEEIDPKTRPYDPARHSAAPTEMSPGRFFAPLRHDVEYQPLSPDLQKKYGLPARVPLSTIQWVNAQEDREDTRAASTLAKQKADEDAKAERKDRDRQRFEDQKVLKGMDPGAAIAREKISDSKKADKIAGNLIMRFPKYEDAIEAAKIDPDIPEELRFAVVSRLEAQRARQPKEGKLGALRAALLAGGGGGQPANPTTPKAGGGAVTPKRDPLGIR